MNQKLKKEELAKTFGLNLNDIDQVIIDNKEYFKFTNPITKEIKMLENNSSKNLSERFKGLQEKISSAQGNDGLKNSEILFDYLERYTTDLVKFINVEELCTYKDGKLYPTIKYNEITAGLQPQKKVEINNLIQYSIALNIKKINIEETFAIDKDNRIIDAKYNLNENKVDMKYATVLKFENDKTMVDQNNLEIDLNSIDYDAILDEIEVAVDKPIEIVGEKINKNDLDKYYNYPEMIDRENMSNRRRMVIVALIKAYKKRKEMNLLKQNKKQYQKVLTKNNNGFINELLFSFIVGLTSGGLLTIFLRIIVNSI